MDKKIGFIGCGNMGSAMLSGILKSEVCSKENIYCSTKSEESKNKLKNKFGINIDSNKEVAKKCDFIILAVKPHFFADIIREIKTEIKNDAVIISVAAGVEIIDLENLFEIKTLKIIRAMPNTPAQVGEGMSAICANKNIEKNDIKEVEEIFSSFGRCEILEEKYFHAFIALCGSSPAYAYMFIEAMGEAAIKAGISSNKAYKLAAQSILGTAKMVLEADEHPAVLRDKVCSPGGTTIEAVIELENAGFKKAIISAMDKCEKKSKEMSKK